MSELWARGTGQGIGLSGHRNVYSAAPTLVDNWSEERFGRELDQKPRPGHLTGHETESMAYTAHDVALVEKAGPPFRGLRADQLFRHGLPDGPERYLGTVTELSYTDPRSRLHGGKSADRVARVLWAGTKHNDRTVPVEGPEPKRFLLARKEAEWAALRNGGKPLLVGSMGTTTHALQAPAAVRAGADSLLARSWGTVPAGGRALETQPHFHKRSMKGAYNLPPPRQL